MANAKLVKLDDGTYVLGLHMTEDECQAMRDTIGQLSGAGLSEITHRGESLASRVGHEKVRLTYDTWIVSWRELKTQFRVGY